jgi:hypothetical protein
MDGQVYRTIVVLSVPGGVLLSSVQVMLGPAIFIAGKIKSKEMRTIRLPVILSDASGEVIMKYILCNFLH